MGGQGAEYHIDWQNVAKSRVRYLSSLKLTASVLFFTAAAAAAAAAAASLIGVRRIFGSISKPRRLPCIGILKPASIVVFSRSRLGHNFNFQLRCTTQTRHERTCARAGSKTNRPPPRVPTWPQKKKNFLKSAEHLCVDSAGHSSSSKRARGKNTAKRPDQTRPDLTKTDKNRWCVQ